MKKLPLNDFHFINGARFISRYNWIIPQSYGDVATELNFIQNSVGFLDRSYLGKVLIMGTDALALLNKTTTNDVNKLLVGKVCDTVFSTPRGRILDYCRVLKLSDAYLIISNYFSSVHLTDWINRFIITEDAEVLDASENYLWLTLLGPKASLLIKNLADDPVNENDDTIWIDHGEFSFPVFKNDNFLTTAYDICLSKDAFIKTVDWVLESLKQIGGGPVGEDAFQVVRIKSGLPDWNCELAEDHNLYEARLTNMVSFTKGGYTGQETISWLDTYDKVQRYLMIVEMEEEPDKKLPLKILFNNDHIGKLTSYAFDPLAKKHLGLAYIDRGYTVDGLNLSIEVKLGEKRIAGGLRTPFRSK